MMSWQIVDACVSLSAQVDALASDFTTLKSSYEALAKNYEEVNQSLKAAYDAKDEAENKILLKQREHETLVSEKDQVIKQLQDEVEKLKSELADANEHADILDLEIFGE